jgi:hypothetical protein
LAGVLAVSGAVSGTAMGLVDSAVSVINQVGS